MWKKTERMVEDVMKNFDFNIRKLPHFILKYDSEVELRKHCRDMIERAISIAKVNNGYIELKEEFLFCYVTCASDKIIGIGLEALAAYSIAYR